MIASRAREELERRGAANVQALVRDAAGPGGTSVVRIGLGNDDPLRQDVEAWLREKELAAEQIDALRHRQLLVWGRIAGVAAVGALVIGIIESS